MGDPAPNDGESPPAQAAQLLAAKRKTTHQQSLPNLRWQFKRFRLETTEFHHQRNSASNQKIGHAGLGDSKDFEKRLVWIKKAARVK